MPNAITITIFHFVIKFAMRKACSLIENLFTEYFYIP